MVPIQMPLRSELSLANSARNFTQTAQCSTATLHSVGARLTLSSYGNRGIAVLIAEPPSLWGLWERDLIISAEGRSVRTPEDLFAVLRTTDAANVHCVVVRNNASAVVSLAVQRYRAALPPPPPRPPVPPTR